MKRLVLHIGLPTDAGMAVSQALADGRAKLAGAGVIVPQALGGTGHHLLHIAALDPARVDLVRARAGYADAGRQAALLEQVPAEIAKTAETGDTVVLSCPMLASLHPEEIARLHRLLKLLAGRIEVIAHIDQQARIACQNFAVQVLTGRAARLDAERSLAGAESWWEAALAMAGTGTMAEILSPPHWLDYLRLRQMWEDAFGPGSVRLLPPPDLTGTKAFSRDIETGFGLPEGSFRAEPAALSPSPSAQWLARARPVNEGLHKLAASGRVIGRRLWRRLLSELEVPGDPLDPGILSVLSDRFAADNALLIAENPSLAACLAPPPRQPFAEADPGAGFRATQYLAAFLPLIDRATAEAKTAVETARKATETPLSTSAEKLMPAPARAQIALLAAGRFAPHNRIGATPEEDIGEPYPTVAFPPPPKGSTGNVIVGCMKNEAPYILEWVAYHRVIGVDNFLIYTNGCEDGTTELLDRLMAMGLVEHRDNNEWKGKSPQQAALNKALKEPVLKKAAWIAHIDVDEFINIRCDTGTLPDFLARVPGATNVAMTWR
ncbi:MAG: glycosyltransferase family 2 protein, partial [Paracoccaceae bacterium]